MIRPMGQFKVEQRTKDAFFNATALLKQWNDMVEENVGNPIFKKKAIADFFRLNQTEDFILALKAEENITSDKHIYAKSKGKLGGTWMHPILFIKFAMWLNPRFEVQVIKFVYDQMISYRNEAGDAYKELGKAVGRIVGKSFMSSAMSQIAKGINHIIFGEHDTLIRNQHGNEEKMRELFRFEHKVADLIDEGFLTDFDGVMKYLRDMWKRQHTPKIFLE